tara:strand:- start:206 stop:442 length:237 start_codon:yes stop_codon:yes gene_type:complete
MYLQSDELRRSEMNWDTVKGNWKQMTGKVKEEWGDLTDDDIKEAEGDRDQLVGKIQAKYGIAKEEAEKQVDSFASKVG